MLIIRGEAADSSQYIYIYIYTVYIHIYIYIYIQYIYSIYCILQFYIYSCNHLQVTDVLIWDLQENLCRNFIKQKDI